jgi:hypothetical protein
MLHPVPTAVRFKVQVCDCSIAGIAGLNLAQGMDALLLCSLRVVKEAVSATR